ncbi:MAG: hypothetical protein E7441_08090 [Ruminococcaceae bacterium]|nr:hypothetical protein [Oscillospiraceae bacterium]
MKKFETSLGWKFYTTLLIISVVFILVYAIDEIFNGIGFFVIKFSKIVVEIFAMGMLPAVLLAWLTDVASLKRKRRQYYRFLDVEKKIIEQKCDDLTGDVLVGLAELGIDDSKTKKTFAEWFEVLIGKNETEESREKVNEEKRHSEIEYFMSWIKDIKEAAQKYRAEVEVYNEVMEPEEREKRKKEIQHLIDVCKRFKSVRTNDSGEQEKVYNYKRFQDVVLQVFPDLEKSYKEKYNSETHAQWEASK